MKTSGCSSKAVLATDFDEVRDFDVEEEEEGLLSLELDRDSLARTESLFSLKTFCHVGFPQQCAWNCTGDICTCKMGDHQF